MMIERRHLARTALALLGVAIVSLGALAPPLPPEDELVYMSDRIAADWNIYSETAGRAPAAVALQTAVGFDWGPRSAPGGGRVAFVSERDGNAEIYVVDFDGDDERRLTHNDDEDWYPSWSPSGTRLVFSSNRDGDHEIWIMDVDGSYDVQLTYNAAYDGEPAYSPDGRMIAFTSDRDGKDDIWIMNVDGTGAKCLTSATPGDCYFPAWSPDGKKIAFTNDPGGGATTDIWTVNADGAGAAAFNPSPATWEWAPAWSPDGAWIAFSSDRTGDQEIFVVNVVGPKVETNMTNSPGSDERYADFFWPRTAVGATWESANSWMPRGEPKEPDRVLIPAGAAVSVASSIKQFARIDVLGALAGTCGVNLQASRAIDIAAGATISGGSASAYGGGCGVDLRAWPGGRIEVSGTVIGGDKPVSASWTEHGGDVDLLAATITIGAGGLVRGGDGGPLNGGSMYTLSLFIAGDGGSVSISGEAITVAGTVQGGCGGTTNRQWKDETTDCRYPQHGGSGGSVTLGSGASADLGGTRSLTITGSVFGGKGGDVVGIHKGEGGAGGDVELAVQWEIHGASTIGAMAVLKGGNGGGRVIPLGAPPRFPLQLPPNYTLTSPPPPGFTLVTPAPPGVGLDPTSGEPMRAGAWIDPDLCTPVSLGLPVWGGLGGDVVIPTPLASTAPATAVLLGGFGGPGEAFAPCPCPGLNLCGADGFDGSVTGQ